MFRLKYYFSVPIISIFILLHFCGSLYGQSFTKITIGDLVNDGANSQACSWGDYDNDGDLDLFVANRNNQNNFLYLNNGNATFTKIS